MAILPKLDLTMMLALSVTALAVDAYWSPERKLSWPALAANTVLGGAAFALLPWCAGVTLCETPCLAQKGKPASA